MYIKRLEIDNFKSFANRTDIPFLPGFTTIAGINGTGKSNIIDSILFALGLSSARALRSENGVADLISTHNNRNEASVKVIFDLQDGIGSEAAFGRRVKKSTNGFSSTYYFNDRPVTLTQMHSELEKFSITPSSYNIIMQGDVQSLILGSPVEQRKFIDEVAGTADFDRKIEGATNDLQAVEDRVQNSNLILDMVQKQLEQLKQDRETALKYQELKNEKDGLEGRITTVKYFSFKKTLDLVHENILKAVKDKKQQEIELENKQKEIEEKKKEFDDICEQVKAQGEDKQLEAKKKVEEKKSEIQRKKDSINYTNKLIETNKQTVYNAQKNIKELEVQKEKTKASILEKENKKAALEDELKIKQTELQNVLSEVTGLNKTADTYLEKRNVLRKNLDELKEKENEIIKEKYPNEARLESLNKEFEDTNKAIEELQNKIKNFDDDKDKLSSQVEVLTKELDELKTLNRAILDEIEKLKTQIQDDMHSIQLANKKIAQLEAEKSAYKRYGSNESVETVMQSGMAGLHAPLSQLAEVESEYIYAISEAMGARSKNIVVDDEHVGSRCIEILKSRGLPKLTFLPLSKIKDVPKNLPLPKLQGVIDYAINLIDFDDKYLKAFFYVLHETIVVDNMETAKKLMGKYRIVTLDGVIFERGGAMTGGAKQGRAQIFGAADDKELANYLKRFEELKKEYSAKEQKKAQYEDKLENIRQKSINAQNSLNAAKYEYSSLLKAHGQFEDILEEKFKRINEITPEIKKTENILDKLEKNHSEILDKILNVQQEITEVEKFIDDGALQKLQELTQGIESEIKQINKNIADVENEIFRDNQNIFFNDNMIQTKQDDIKRRLQDNEGLEKDKVKAELEIKEISTVLEELEKEVVELGKNLVELQNIRQKIQNEMLDVQNQKNILENDIERIQESIDSFKERRNDIEPKLKEVLDELKEKNIDTKSLEPTEISIEEITFEIQKLQKKMDALGLINMRAIEDYNEVLNKEKELSAKIETLENEKNEILSRMTGYENLKKETFLKTFNSVNEYFKEIFTKLTDGYGELILDNPENPFQGGLRLKGRQKNKDEQKLAGMSGGEKTLMALSLVFAVQRYMPAPFYALDEVDAALDGFNVEKIAEMINSQAKETQFVVISQRSQMIDSSDIMIGVAQNRGRTMISGIKNKV